MSRWWECKMVPLPWRFLKILKENYHEIWQFLFWFFTQEN